MPANNPNSMQFEVYTTHIRGVARESSLYYLIMDLKNSSLLTQLGITEEIRELNNSDRQAYLFILDNKNINKLFEDEGYLLVDAHLTVDKIYYKDNSNKSLHGFSLAHYTEEHINKENEKSIKVHVYFNSRGEYLYTQIKEIELEADRFVEKKIPYIMYESLIKHNCKKALEILTILLKEKSKRYLEATEKALFLEKKMLSISIAKQKKRLDKYREETQNFVEAIKTLNRYNDGEIDKRDSLAKSHLKWLENQAELLPFSALNSSGSNSQLNSSGSNSQEEDLIIKDDNDDKIIVTKELLKHHWVPNYENEKNRLHVRLKQLYSQLIEISKQDNLSSTSEAKIAIDKNKLIQEIREIILQIEFLPKQVRRTPVLVAEIEDIEQYINLHALPLTKLFQKKCLQGDPVAVKELFPYINRRISLEFYFDFIIELLKNLSTQQDEDNLVKVGDFLFANSQEYDNNIILGKLDIMLQPEDANCPAMSVLFAAFIHNKPLLFNMLCNHGLNLNGPGIMYNYEGKKRVISLAKALISVASFQKTGINLHETIATLVDKGMLLEGGNAEECSTEESLAVLSLIFRKQNKKELLKQIKENFLNHVMLKSSNTYSSTLNSLFNIHSCLQLVCDNSEILNEMDIKTIDLLIDHSSFKSVVLSLATITNYKSMYATFVRTATQSLFCVDKRIKIEKIIADYGVPDCLEKSGFSFIFNPAECSNITTKICLVIPRLLARLANLSLQTISKDCIDQLYKELFLQVIFYNNELNQIIKQAHHTEKEVKILTSKLSIYIRSCMILSISFLPINKNNIIKLMGLFYFLGRAKEISNDPADAWMFYKGAVTVGQHHLYLQELQYNEIYQDALNKTSGNTGILYGGRMGYLPVWRNFATASSSSSVTPNASREIKQKAQSKKGYCSE